MTLDRERIKTIIIGVGVFIIVTIPINIYISTSTKKSLSAKPNKYERGIPSSEETTTVIFNVIDNELTADDPSEYNILAQKNHELPRSQLQWDLNMDKTLIQSNVLDEMEQNMSFERFEKSSEAYQKQLKQIEARIIKYEEISQKDPSNEEARNRLQSLYMLKSTLKVLKDKIVNEGYQ